MSKKIGLEIGNKKTKLVIGRNHGVKFELLDYEIIDTLDGVFSIDGEVDIMKMELPIKDALKRLKIRSGDLYVSINNEKVIIRTRELPRVSQKEMMEIVRFEAESFLPYDISAFYVDYKVIDEVVQENDESLFNVMIIAAPIDLVGQYVELSSALNLRFKLATAYTEVITKFMKHHLLNENLNMLFVDLGGKYTNMTLFEGHQYFANIKTERGISGMYERLLDNYGYTESDVNHYLFSYKESDDNQKIDIIKNTKASNQASVKDLQKRLQEISAFKKNLNSADDEILSKRNKEYEYLINEISRMVDFFKTRKYGTYVDIIYVYGGGAYLSGFISQVEDQLHIKCSKLPKEAFESKLENLSFDLMLPAIGACLGGK